MTQPLAVVPARRSTVAVDLRSVFRHAASSTWVVTSAAQGRPVGFTVISVVSVSVDPPLISLNVARTSSSREVLQSSGRLAVHLLGEDQGSIAARFAGERAQRFVHDHTWYWHPDDELPAVSGAPARLSGSIVAEYEAGDSLLLTVQVTQAQVDGHRAPLVHHQGRYRSLS